MPGSACIVYNEPCLRNHPPRPIEVEEDTAPGMAVPPAHVYADIPPLDRVGFPKPTPAEEPFLNKVSISQSRPINISIIMIRVHDQNVCTQFP